MASAVLDTTILVSAFLTPGRGGAAFALVGLAASRAFELYISQPILDEVADVLLRRARIRRRFRYENEAVQAYLEWVVSNASTVGNLASLNVVRDANDDAILATAVAAAADFLVSRDKDLLVIGKYEGVAILAPEAFLAFLRG